MLPRYQEWLTYLFDHEIVPGLPEWYWQENAPVFEATPAEVAELWIAMMKNAETDLLDYSDAQLGQGLWYLFSNACSDHSFQVTSGDLPVKKVAEVYDSLRWLYTGLFSRRCLPVLGHLSEEGSPLNGICYMLWDVSPLGWPPENDRTPAVVTALFGVLEHALDLPHRACAESALHGLGEIQSRYPERVEAVIRPRLLRLARDKSLYPYALGALEGGIL